MVEVFEPGALRINQQPVTGDRLGEIFKLRASRAAFLRGEPRVEFSRVARVIDVMHPVGISSVGLLSPDLEKGRY